MVVTSGSRNWPTDIEELRKFINTVGQTSLVRRHRSTAVDTAVKWVVILIHGISLCVSIN